MAGFALFISKLLNYLAHLFLADNTDASRIGNLLGDFTHGTLEDLRTRFPAEVVHGIRMHRAVDRFTDSHQIFKKSRALLAPTRQRFAGIIVDIIFDHFLSIHWDQFCATPLEDFVQEVYLALDAHPEWRVGRLDKGYPWIKKDNLFMRYQTLEGIEVTFKRVSQRGPKLAPIAGGIHDLRDHFGSFERYFLEYFPDLIHFVAKWKKEHPLPK